ncbi:MAG: hypothetical protein ACD_45C00159G0009 [uncultured bacterium]|nr:MAG: hypothetical protein ACD_45C00159G0009 [uncultured bacterium]
MANKLLRRFMDRMPASWVRVMLNRWRPFRGAGITVDRISPDFLTIEASLRLYWYNTNYVGVHFGGSIFVLTDAFYMLILMKNLREDYIVWDKAASIEFKKPGRGRLRATFTFTPEEIAAIRAKADSEGKYIFEQTIDVTDAEGNVVASVIRTIYVRRKTLK